MPGRPTCRGDRTVRVRRGCARSPRAEPQADRCRRRMTQTLAAVADLRSYASAASRKSLRCKAHRLDNVLITRAAAQVPAQRLANFGVRRTWTNAQQGHRRDQHARRAKSTLEPVRIPECLLNGMQAVGCWRQALDGRDLRSVCLDREHQTRTRWSAIDQDRARAAHSVLAANVRPGQMQLVA